MSRFLTQALTILVSANLDCVYPIVFILKWFWCQLFWVILCQVLFVEEVASGCLVEQDREWTRYPLSFSWNIPTSSIWGVPSSCSTTHSAVIAQDLRRTMGRMSAKYHLIFFLEKLHLFKWWSTPSQIIKFWACMKPDPQDALILQNRAEGKTPYSLNIPTKLGEVRFLKINPDDSVWFLRLCKLGGCRDVCFCAPWMRYFKILRAAWTETGVRRPSLRKQSLNITQIYFQCAGTGH